VLTIRDESISSDLGRSPLDGSLFVFIARGMAGLR
jgi:hypothetical protein